MKIHCCLKSTSGNGEIILTSQMYASKSTAKKGIASVQKNAADSSKFDQKTNSGGKHYFVLKAANHQVIGNGQSYSSAASMKKGIKSAQTNAPKAKILDETK